MQSRLKLLFVDNSVDTFCSYRMPLALAASQAGFEIHVAAPPGHCESMIRDAGFTFHPLPMTRSGMGVGELACLMHLYLLYERLKPDLVHHLRLKPVLYGGLAAYAARVPAQVSMPTGLGHVFTAQTRKALVLRTITLAGCGVAFRHKNLKVIFQNPDDLAVFIDSKMLRKDKGVLIRGSGVDISEFVLTPEPAGRPVVMLATRMLRDKGVLEFVEVAKTLKARGSDARFVLVGDTDPGNPTAVPAAQLQDWHNAGLVEWWGYHEDMRQVLGQANIVCLPSYREGVPKVLIEAAAAGRAIVTTDAPGCREVVRHGQNGLLVPPRDSKGLTEAISFLLANPGVRARMGRRGRHAAVANFSLDRVIAETIETYHDVLGRVPVKAGDRGSRIAKRLLDVFVSGLGLLATGPLFAMIALVIKVTSPGPVFYRGARTGRENTIFHMWKFRSMVVDAELRGGSATANDDARITPAGRFLRRYKLDELPQLINVFVGEMSLVGPRPEVQKYTDLLIGEQRAILKLRPGITDWASIWNSNEGEVLAGSSDPEAAYEELIRPTKIALQLKYYREHSFWIDLNILFETVRKLLQPQHVPNELRGIPKIIHYKDLVKA
jgi:lipopolysaccharide/colanic/teichoic acid biosynthesis glycosyltransferase/glycosyltransferase involved in cell wall biosynthesis